MYHKVTAQYCNFIPTLDIKIFAKQINLIRKLYDIISIDDILTERIKKGRKTKLIVTFDDGYRCIYKYAYPILNKYKIPATVFLTVQSIEENTPIWPDLIIYYIKSTKERLLELIIEQRKLSLDLSSTEKKLKAIKLVKDIFKKIPSQQRLLLTDELKKQLEVDNPREEILNMLSWDEIKEMSKHLITFGGHTMTHPILSQMSFNDVKSEVLESKKIIENKIGKPIFTFAYPNGESGDFNEAIKHILKESDYKLACTTIFGSNNFNSDPYVLKRVYTSGDSLLKFTCRLLRA